jgi:hypothetical protein
MIKKFCENCGSPLPFFANSGSRLEGATCCSFDHGCLWRAPSVSVGRCEQRIARPFAERKATMFLRETGHRRTKVVRGANEDNGPRAKNGRKWRAGGVRGVQKQETLRKPRVARAVFGRFRRAIGWGYVVRRLYDGLPSPSGGSIGAGRASGTRMTFAERKAPESRRR